MCNGNKVDSDSNSGLLLFDVTTNWIDLSGGATHVSWTSFLEIDIEYVAVHLLYCNKVQQTHSIDILQMQ